MHNLSENHIDYGMEHVVYLMVKKENKGSREPVVVERMQVDQMQLSRVTLLEAYLEAWQQPSHVVGVILDKICTGCTGERSRYRCFPDYQAWDRSFTRYLQKHQLTREWLRVCHIPVYDGYDVTEQLQTMMKWVAGWQQLSQILVLGYDPGILVCMPRLARRAREIHFYLEYAPREMEELREWIYEEYGLMTRWQVLEGRLSSEAEMEEGLSAEAELEAAEQKRQCYRGLNRYLREYQTPCLVIDLTGEAHIPVTGLPRGSMWWDLGAKEEKRHLLEDRPMGISYHSLLTLWRDLKILTGT